MRPGYVLVHIPLNHFIPAEAVVEIEARLYCSGGCAANAYHATGSVKGVYDYGCKLFRKRMECAIMVQVAEKLGDPQ